MSEQLESVETQLLTEIRRARKATEGIQTLLTIWFIIALLGAIVITALALT